ncbi:LexA family protein [Gehongia tenuis]|uniref:Helix-turn-helix domain-containing protein n=1 Tax=Gehongia tenuis TaxID=2763655 RepID=A0A926D7H3_9FIRM|nr:XRE family transcriptional regulator [Gehongia tenuis]MBC8531780.1 helix-turn-helix domain-containing protein [Gehongia tenuis]
MILGDIISDYRKDHNMNMQEFADRAGLSKAYISILERNYNPKSGKPPIPSLETIKAVAVVVGLDVNDVISALDSDQQVSLKPDATLPDNIMPLPKMRKVPLLGTIACGEPILAQENIEDEVDMPENVHADFCLRCKGESMIGARIQDGDIVYIHQQPDVENGEIAAVIIDDEATLKRVYKYPNKVVLQPENPQYAPLVYVGTELEAIRIIGKAVAFLSNVV